MSEVIGTASRVKYHEARRAFAAGATVMVSEYGHEETRTVTRITTTHTKESTTWLELDEQVKMWRNRYPNQRYYIVESLVNA